MLGLMLRMITAAGKGVNIFKLIKHYKRQFGMTMEFKEIFLDFMFITNFIFIWS
jgi:hypothetical protein